MTLNFLEVAEAYKNRTISPNDERVKQVEQMIHSMASTEDGRTEIAELIGIYLQNTMPFVDIAPFITDNRHFNYGERPEFRLKKKGIKAYWIAPNSSTPKSRNYQETLGMDFETVSVRPECLLDELKSGRLGTLQDIMRDAQEALRIAICEKVYTILSQVYNEQNNAEYTTVMTQKLAKESLEEVIDKVVYRTGNRAVIIGDQMLTNQIMGFDGFTPEAQEEIRKTGSIGYFRGARIIGTPKMIDEANNNKVVVPNNRLFVVGDKIGYSATYGDNKTGQETSIEDWSWNARIDTEYGLAVTKPEGIHVIDIK